ncbi:hypothetical protein ACFQUU_08585 [Herbaspirillum sp. GCM10030257]|uniref:hypothetical protein n=1 Tax=Herbaspirillum sp. GCM10030257 TaxID=3273393 RepID=UPI003610E835
MEGDQTVEIRIIKGGVPVSIFSSANATALDVLSFLPQVIDAIGLERLARKEGRTFEHPLADSVGALPLKGAAELVTLVIPKDPQ